MDEDLSALNLRRLAEDLGDGDVSEEMLARLAADPRAGAAALLGRLRRRRGRQDARRKRLEELLQLERECWNRGARHVAGVDEAGLGPLAGPVVAAAVILDPASIPLGIDDSKKLDAATRERLAQEIRASAMAVSVGIAEVDDVDRLNVYHAGLLSMRRAVEGLATQPCHVLVDARQIPGLVAAQTAYVKGDARSASIAAASIIAKTTRDGLMEELDAKYPGYDFSRHKGYATAAHRDAIRRLGASPVHRLSYAAVQELIVR